MYSPEYSVSNLRSPCHAGLIEVGGQLVSGAHFAQRIVEPDRYRELLDVLDRRKRVGATTKASPNHLLAGLAKCGTCGRRLYLISPKGSVKHYRCFGNKTDDQNACPGFMAQAHKVEFALYREISDLAQDARLASAAEEEIGSMLGVRRKEIEAILSSTRKELKQLPEKRGELFDQLVMGRIDASAIATYEQMFSSRAAECEARIAELESELKDVSGLERRVRASMQALSTFPVVWENLNIDEKRELLANMVESLRFTREGQNVVMDLKLIFRDPRRIVIPYETRKPGSQAGVNGLTQRQLAVLDLLAQGLSRKEIAQRMGILQMAVNSHVCAIRRQLGVRAISEAVDAAFERIASTRGLLPTDGRRRPPQRSQRPLTPRELDLLRRLAAGESLSAIAREEGRAIGSVCTRLSSAKRKLGVAMREEAIAAAKEKKLL